jgi:hypothetical protein
MPVSIKTRYRTGEICQESGIYGFDGLPRWYVIPGTHARGEAYSAKRRQDVSADSLHQQELLLETASTNISENAGRADGNSSPSLS